MGQAGGCWVEVILLNVVLRFKQNSPIQYVIFCVLHGEVHQAAIQKADGGRDDKKSARESMSQCLNRFQDDSLFRAR